MSFRKRNVVVSSPGTAGLPIRQAEKVEVPGVRPSPLDGRLTTSTGTRSLDTLLAGHAGLPLGTSVLIEESGTTDFSGALLRYFAAEGVVQGHVVHVLGVSDAWARELPGIQAEKKSSEKSTEQKIQGDKMKIAWRYERLGEFGKEKSTSITGEDGKEKIFCHDFDLSKRLTLPPPQMLRCVPVTQQLFGGFISHIQSQLASHPPTTIHRIIIPTLLSPLLYPSTASQPHLILPFLHSLRALLRKYPTQLSILLTLPLTLHPRTTGLTRWIESLSDCVLELSPFPSHATVASASSSTSSAALPTEEPPQGMLRVHRLPIFHEKGGGGAMDGDDLAFTLSRRRGLCIKPFSLPPVDEDTEAERKGSKGDHSQEGHSHGKQTKVDIEF